MPDHSEQHTEEPVDRADVDLGMDGPLVAIPVEVPGPVRVQTLGSECTTAVSYNLSPDNGVPTTQLVLPADPRRSRAILIASGDDIFIGRTPQEVRAGTAFRWPAGQPFTVHTRTALYARSASTTVAVISVYVEQLVG